MTAHEGGHVAEGEWPRRKRQTLRSPKASSGSPPQQHRVCAGLHQKVVEKSATWQPMRGGGPRGKRRVTASKAVSLRSPKSSGSPPQQHRLCAGLHQKVVEKSPGSPVTAVGSPCDEMESREGGPKDRRPLKPPRRGPSCTHNRSGPHEGGALSGHRRCFPLI